MSVVTLRSEDGALEELVLIEVQSFAAMDDGSPLGGQFLGTLEVKGGKVTLTNGPRTLLGTLISLPKPLVLMAKTDMVEMCEDDPSRQSTVLSAHGVVRKKVVFSGRPQLSV
eukprot:TRINITY_DN69829_c0_g1_i1.p1 TRINITY_DN69829_c0_g1~~TRINITY_DN69829_c0_g1_i1.p1  ORF type:complete len:112 (-),score=18.41 TRINITY_DN69829_c0_g1_i1:83-418(-)